MTPTSSQQLISLSKREKNANKRIRLLAVAYFLESQNCTQVARRLNVSRSSVNKWVSNYLSIGISGLDDKKRYGRKCSITEKQKHQLSTYIEKQSSSAEGGRLTGHDVKAYIFKAFGVNYHLNHVYKLLKLIGFSWITSRSKHPKQSQEAQDDFKKTGN